MGMCKTVSGRSGVGACQSVGMNGRRAGKEWVDAYLVGFECYLHSNFPRDGFVVVRFESVRRLDI